MNSTLPDLLQGFAGIAAMALFFLAPGFLAGRLTGVGGFRARSRAEQALWSVALSMPLAVALCALAGQVISPPALNGLFATFDLTALFFLVREGRTRLKSLAPLRVLLPQTRATRAMLLLMALFGVYCIVAVTDIQIGHRLYVSTVIADWSVRVQMVKAAMRSAASGTAVPPLNGLSTLSVAGIGHAPPMRYYYFWYVLVAHVARTFHLGAQATLAASCAWAGWSLLASAFLALKYFLGFRLGGHLRRSCFLLLLVGAVLGLDILPTALLWLAPKLHPYSEMEYWHQDRTPSFLGAVLYAPHHMAAFSALLTGFLLLLVTRSRLRQTPGQEPGSTVIPAAPSLGQSLAAAAFAGVAFAAAAGTSLFPTFCFVFVLSFWAIDLLRRREFTVVAALALSGLLALALAHPYLHELSAGSSAASGFANLRWRNDDFFAMQQARHHLLLGHGALLAFLARQPMVLVMDFFDLGFYTLVLLQGVRVLREKGRLLPGECALVALVAGAAAPAFSLSSTATSGPNDLGVDAGFLLRLALQLAAIPWVWNAWQRRRAGEWSRASRAERWSFRLAALLFLLGLSAQLYQSPSERLYFAIVGSGKVSKQMDTFTKDRLPERLYNIRAAYAALDAQMAPSAPDTEALQFNPVGVMQPAETLYSDHQIAAWDTGCGTSYGGDYAHCAPLYHGLLFLFGNTEAGVLAGRAENDRQDGAAARVATLPDFAAACRTLHLRALVAESTDSIWQQPSSWVWTAPLLTGNETVRILRCPA